MGKAASPDHVLWDEAERARRGVEVIWSDRGGEATYHGPGQLVGYPIVDLARLGLTIPGYVDALEQSLIQYLAGLGIQGDEGLREQVVARALTAVEVRGRVADGDVQHAQVGIQGW